MTWTYRQPPQPTQRKPRVTSSAVNLIVKVQNEAVEIVESDLHFLVEVVIELRLWRKTGVDKRPGLGPTFFLRPDGTPELQLSGFRIDLEYTSEAFFHRTGVGPRPDLEPTHFTRPVAAQFVIKVQNESVEIVESDLRILGLVRLQAETVEIAEADLRFVVRKIVQFVQQTTGGSPIALLAPTRFLRPGLRIIKLQAEAVEITEDDIPVLGLVRIQNESVEITEADLRFLTSVIARLVYRTGVGPKPDLEPTHFIRPGLRIIKLQGETVEISETDLTFKGLVKVQGEVVEIPETDLSVKGLVKVQDEIVEIDETDLSFAIQRIVEWAQRTTGGPTKADLVRTRFTRPGLVLIKVQNESLEITESDIRILGLVRLHGETVEINETDLHFVKRAITELVHRTGGLVRPGLGVTYFVRPLIPGVFIVKIQSESVEINEADITVLGFVRVQNEEVQIVETDLNVVIQRIVDFVNRTTGGPAGLGSEPTYFIRPNAQVFIVKVVDESIQISETDLHFLGLMRQVDEPVQITEQDIRVRTLVRIRNETVEIPESEIHLRDLVRIQEETVQIVEQAIAARGLTRQQNAAIELSEQDLYRLGKVRVQNEEVQIVEGDIHVVGAVIPTPPFVTITLIVESKFRDVIVSDRFRDAIVEEG